MTYPTSPSTETIGCIIIWLMILAPFICMILGSFIKDKEKTYYKRKPLPQNWHYIANCVRDRDNNICQLCGDKGWEVHHIIPRGRSGSTDSPHNLMTLCPMCHSKQPRY